MLYLYRSVVAGIWPITISKIENQKKLIYAQLKAKKSHEAWHDFDMKVS